MDFLIMGGFFLWQVCLLIESSCYREEARPFPPGSVSGLGLFNVFISVTDKEIKCILSKFFVDTKLCDALTCLKDGMPSRGI